MKRFGFLSFGHYGPNNSDYTAADMLKQAVDIAVAGDELGVGGAYFRVHHFARQAGSPFPLLSAIAAKTTNIEVGTGVIDMRYENPFQLAEETATLDLLADQRIAIGISRGSPEPALRGWETWGYGNSEDPRGADIARDKFELFLRAIKGKATALADPEQFPAGGRLMVQPHVPDLYQRIWWGAGTRETAEWAAAQGVNLMSSTLLTEATGSSFASLQAEQIDRYRAAWQEAGHEWQPRVSVSRSIFPIVSETDQLMYQGAADTDGVGEIDGLLATFGKTYAGTPDQLIEQLATDEAVHKADTLMLTIPAQIGVEHNVRLLEAFANKIAPELHKLDRS